ncbi:MAG: hypothetical protein M3N38_12665 [Pseudomonadota bacterium]|nr:hypothetical protein [Pseudomonadota bacterium]
MSQIETIMLVALGFAIAALIALFLSRFFWAVALRLGNKRLLRSTPTTIAELRADRDRLRAEYAMLSRKLQLKMDNIKTKLAEQMAEVTRNRNRIDHLIVEVRTRDAMLGDREAEITRLKAHVDPLEAELASRTKSVQSSKEQLRGRDAEVARHQKLVDQLRAEIAERDKRIEVLKNEAVGRETSVMLANNEVLTAQDRLKKRIEDLTSLSSQIEAQRSRLAQEKSEFESLKSELVAVKEETEPVAAPEPVVPETVVAAVEPEELPAIVPREEFPAAIATEEFAVEVPQEELPAVSVQPEFSPSVEAANADQLVFAESMAAAVDELPPEEPLVVTESEPSEIEVEPRKLDTSFSARIAELQGDQDEEPAATPPAPTPPAPSESESDNASASPRGKLRAVTNVISLAARIRALQKTAGE